MSSTTCSDSEAIRASISKRERRKAGGSHLSNRADNSRTAASPRAATSARMASTVARTLRSASEVSASDWPCFNTRIMPSSLYSAVQPPSTRNAVPVTSADASEAR
jgi:hypothetical protein